MTPTPCASITVVIASHGRPDALPTLLSSLQRQTLPPSAFTVTVVVDGIDRYQQAYQQVLDKFRAGSSFDLQFQFQENAGQSVARDRAIAATQSEWIVIVDDDMDLEPQFLEEHLRLLRRGGPKAVVIGRVIPEENWRETPLYEAVRTSHMLEWHDHLTRTGERPWGQTFVTQNVAFSRGFYLEVGGFDDRLRLGEDMELGLRFELAGSAFVFGDKAAAVHRSRIGSYDAWVRRCTEYGRVGVYVFNKLGTASAHPLRNLVNGSRLNAIAVYACCWSRFVATRSIAALRLLGTGLSACGLTSAGIATHKAILAIAYHVGVKDALGSWRNVLHARKMFIASADSPRRPT